MAQQQHFVTAATQEKHPAVRRVLGLNAWKIGSWQEYAKWKKHATRWVTIEWKEKTARLAVSRGFAEVVE